jgi:hypothetical protein
LDQAAAENGEMSDSFGSAGPYGTMLGNLQSYMGALAEHHGLIKPKIVSSAPQSPQPSENIDLNALSGGQAPSGGMMQE